MLLVEEYFFDLYLINLIHLLNDLVFHRSYEKSQLGPLSLTCLLFFFLIILDVLHVRLPL